MLLVLWLVTGSTGHGFLFFFIPLYPILAHTFKLCCCPHNIKKQPPGGVLQKRYSVLPEGLSLVLADIYHQNWLFSQVDKKFSQVV